MYLSCFGVQHKEISFPREENTKMHPKNHRWLSILVGTLKAVCSSSTQDQGGLEGQRNPHPSHKVGLSTGGRLYPPQFTLQAGAALTACGHTSPGGGKHVLPGPAHSGRTSLCLPSRMSGFSDVVRNPHLELQARWTATSPSHHPGVE